MEIKTFLLSLPFAVTCFSDFYNIKAGQARSVKAPESESDCFGDNYPHVFLKNYKLINKR